MTNLIKNKQGTTRAVIVDEKLSEIKLKRLISAELGDDVSFLDFRQYGRHVFPFGEFIGTFIRVMGVKNDW